MMMTMVMETLGRIMVTSVTVVMTIMRMMMNDMMVIMFLIFETLKRHATMMMMMMLLMLISDQVSDLRAVFNTVPPVSRFQLGQQNSLS